MRKRSATWNLEELDDCWKTKLLSNKFYIKECIGDGNCQFRSIETALKTAGFKLKHTKLRNLIARYIRQITDQEFHMIVQSYRLEKDNGEFEGGWDPYQISDKKDFIKEVSKPGFHFQGDYVTLSLLSRAIKVDFILFTSDYNVIDISTDNKNQYIILLFYDKLKRHYKTIGIKDSDLSIVSFFDRNNLPSELMLILNKYNHIQKHVDNICNSLTTLKLNSIIQLVENNLKCTLLPQDKTYCLKAVKNYIDSKVT
jgi:hypothetical protein